MADWRWRRPTRRQVAGLADGVNDEFVGLARSVMRLLTWQYRPTSEAPASLPPPGGASVRSSRPRLSRTPSGVDFSPLGADVLTSLADRATAVLSRRRPTEASDSAGLVPDKTTTELEPHKVCPRRLRELFHVDPRRRLAAASWIRKVGAVEAVPTLESVLLIEESHDVREEISRVLNELGAQGAPDRWAGGVRRLHEGNTCFGDTMIKED